MPINPASYHEGQFRLTQGLGAKLNAGDMTFEPVGFAGLYLLVSQFPYPFLSGGQAIEVPEAGGGTSLEQAPLKTDFQGPFSMHETVAGSARKFFEDVIQAGGYFDARIYEGTPERHTSSYLIERAFVQIDPVDVDWENKMQVLRLTGTVNYRFFGKRYAGNV